MPREPAPGGPEPARTAAADVPHEHVPDKIPSDGIATDKSQQRLPADAIPSDENLPGTNGEEDEMSWLQKLMPSRIRTEGTTSKGKVPEGLWGKCDGCGAVLYGPELDRNLQVCPKCGHHHAIAARKRLAALFDEGSGEELFTTLEPVDALKFKDSKTYKARIAAAQKATGEKDAMVAMRGTLKERPLVAVAFEFAYMGGSMGSVVGEKFTLAAEHALEHRIPFV